MPEIKRAPDAADVDATIQAAIEHARHWPEEVEIVTEDGEVIRVQADPHPPHHVIYEEPPVG